MIPAAALPCHSPRYYGHRYYPPGQTQAPKGAAYAPEAHVFLILDREIGW